MEIFVAFLPLLLWLGLVIFLLKKFGLNKFIFVLCVVFTAILNFRAAILSSSLSLHILINIIAQTLFLYVVVSFIDILIKKIRKPRASNEKK